MTEQSDETTPSSPAPKKSLRFLIKKEPMEVSSLGVVLVDRLTLGVMRKLGKLLDREKNASDLDIARTLLGAVIYLPGTDEGEGERLLNSDEIAQVPEADIHAFAQAFNERQGWSADSGDVPSIKLLAEKLREELKSLADSINKSLNFGNSIFSESTQRLMAESALIGETLKAYSGASELARRYEMAASPVEKYLKAMPVLQAAMKTIAENEKLKSSIGGLDLAKQLAGIDRSVIPDISLAPPRYDISELHQKAVENSPMVRSARALSSLDTKVDEVLEIAQDIAELHGKTNEAVLSGLSNLSDKWKQDEASATKSLKWAVRAIFASVFLSLVAIGQDYYTNRSNDREQLETKTLLAEQVRLAKEAGISQNKTAQALEGRVKELEGKLAAQALRNARATKKLPSEQK